MTRKVAALGVVIVLVAGCGGDDDDGTGDTSPQPSATTPATTPPDASAPTDDTTDDTTPPEASAPADDTTATTDPGAADGAADLESLYAAARECGDPRVVVYGPGAAAWEPNVVLFNQDYPEIPVELVHLVGPEQITRLEAEVDSGNVVGDLVFSTQFSGAFDPAYAEWFEPFLPAGAEQLADGLVDPGDAPYWYAPYGGLFGWSYNTNEVDADAAPTWDVVITDEYRGRVALTDPSVPNATSATLWLAHDLGLIDDQWFSDMAANEPNIVGESARAGQALVTGEAAASPYPFSLAKALAVDGAPVAFNPVGAISLPAVVGVLKESQCPAAAKLFATYLLTPTSQEQIARQGQEPYMPGAPLPEELGGVQPELYVIEDAQEYIDMQNAVMETAGEAFGR